MSKFRLLAKESAGSSYYRHENAPFSAFIIYICHFCSRPTFLDGSGEQIPSVAFGNEVNGVDDETVRNLYQEAPKSNFSKL